MEKDVVILNEKAANILGFRLAADAVGETITVNRHVVQVVGVARNFHHETLRQAIEPYIYQFKHPHEFGYYPALVSTADVV